MKFEKLSDRVQNPNALSGDELIHVVKLGTPNKSWKDTIGRVKDFVLSFAFGKCAIYNSLGIPTFYSTLQAAITAAAVGNSIKLYADIAEDIVIDKDLTIIGNGHKIEPADSAECVTIENGAKVKISDLYIYSESASYPAVKVFEVSELDMTGSTIETTALTSLNIVEGKVIGGYSKGGIVLVASTSTLENHKHYGTVNTYGVSCVGNMRKCIVEATGRIALNMQVATSLVEDTILISDNYAATISKGRALSCLFVSTGSAAIALNDNPSTGYESTLKDCRMVSTYNNSAGHTVLILNTNTAKHRLIDCYFETANASAYAVNAGNSQNMGIFGGKFNTTLGINSNVTNDIRTADAQGNIFIK